MKNKIIDRKGFGGSIKFLGLMVCTGIFIIYNTNNVWAANPANAPTKGSVIAGYLNDPELDTISANSVYKAPEGEIKATYKSVEDMRINAINHGEGDYIQTLNYYEGVAGGGAVYRVEKSNYTTDNGGTIIDLPGDIRCKLASGNDTVSPLQFGAYGDGITDDHAALETTFKSGFGTVILEGRTYISNDTIWIAQSNLIIEGMGATITCDNNFGSYQEEDKKNRTQVYVTNCSNLIIRHLRIRDGQTTDHGRGGMSLQAVRNVDISWCTFEIPEGITADTDNVACTLSFQNGWHDVSTTHCEIINMSGVNEGGAVGFNDVYASGSDNALFENNIVRYNVKDEVIAIFSHSQGGSEYFNRKSYIRNILIRHNEFYGPKSADWKRDLDFSVGYDDSLEVDNVVYEENYFETDAVWAFMTFSKTATNCAARGNVIHVTQTSNSTSMTVFKGSGAEQAIVEDNMITVSTENENMPSSIAMGNLLFRNNQVTSNCDINCLFEYGVDSEKNQIQVNGMVKKAIAFQGRNMIDTDIVVTGACGSMYESYNMVMKKDILWKGNHIEIPNAVSTGCVLNFNGITMNGYKFILENNVISTPSATKNSLFLYDSLKDENPQEQQILMKGNQFGAFYCKGNKVDIYRVNNVFNSYDNTTIRDYEVVFELDGKGTAEPQSVMEGDLAKEPEVKNLEGYKLLGWYADNKFNLPWDFDVNTISQNTIIYAKLEKNSAEKNPPSVSDNESTNPKPETEEQESTNPGPEAGEEESTNPKPETGEQESTKLEPETEAQNQPVKVSKIVINAPSKKLAAGKKVQLAVAISPSNAANTDVTWKTSNSKYAKVSKKGKLTLKKAGIGKTVTITATAKDDSGKKASIKIKIMKDAVKSIKITAPKKTLKAGKTMTLKKTIKTTGKNVNKTLTWKSSNTKYATVNKKGKVTAKKAGRGKTVTITAVTTDGSNKKAKVKIKII